MKQSITVISLAVLVSTAWAFDPNNAREAYRLGDYVKASDALQNEKRLDPVEAYYLGRMQLYGFGMLKNNATGISYITQAAERGYLPAQNFMARFSLLVKRDPAEALKWFKKAADQDDTQAQLYCAGAYLYAYGTKRNPDVARRYYIGAAKNGNALAQVTLAEHFLDSKHSSNKKLGLIWLEKALSQNDPKAKVLMAEVLREGTGGVEKDRVASQQQLDAAIQQGYLPALYQKGLWAVEDKQYPQARDLFIQASKLNYVPAELALGQMFLIKDTETYDPQKGFLWTLKAAQNGSKEARYAVVDLYKEGVGTEVSEPLAKEWTDRAKQLPGPTAESEVIQWLSHGKAKAFHDVGLRMTGIFGDWQNPGAQQENDYNSAPQMNRLTREALFKPRFEMIKPTQIPISDYYAAYLDTLGDANEDALIFPHYPLTYADPQKPLSEDDLKHFEGRALLGDATLQFELAQRFQYGNGIEKDMEKAIEYYNMAANQLDLRALYTLGIIHLGGLGVPQDVKQGLAYLNDAAFKGNSYAEYVLGRLYEQGYQAQDGKPVIKPDLERAASLYTLASANNFGMAQFRLAELMMHQQKQADMTRKAQRKRHRMIKTLYAGALKDGIKSAALPLAFFHAMEKDPNKQKAAFEVALNAAKDGSVGGTLLVGLMYDRGLGTKPDHGDALDWYQKSKDNPIVAFIVGTEVSLGNGIRKNVEEGRALLQKASQAGFPYADLNLAILKHQAGEAFIPDLDKARMAGNSTAGLLLADYYLSKASNDTEMKQARDIYESFAEKGSAVGQLKLGFMMEQGLGGKVNKSESEHWYSLSARQDQPVAQYLLARLYQMGWPDNKPQYALAKHWYTKAQNNYYPASVALGFIQDALEDDYVNAAISYARAAKAGDPVAQYNLGLIYEDGKGCVVNVEKAKEMYLLAAKKNHAQSMRQLGRLSFSGLLGKRDDKAAFEWYQKAARLGDRDALYQVGLFCETGVATKTDSEKAAKYYQLAADKGHVKAKLALARMYRHGIGVPKDPEKAESIYQALADQNNATAQYQLALFYYDGDAGEAKPEKGKVWLQRAAKNGNPQAQKTLQRLTAESNPQVSYIESLPVVPTKPFWA